MLCVLQSATHTHCAVLQANCDGLGTCEGTDKWPYGVCTLKKVASPSTPEWWSNNNGECFTAAAVAAAE